MMLMCPPLTMLLAWVAFDEKVTALDCAGGGITLACVYFSEAKTDERKIEEGGGEQEQELELLAGGA